MWGPRTASASVRLGTRLLLNGFSLLTISGRFPTKKLGEACAHLPQLLLQLLHPNRDVIFGWCRNRLGHRADSDNLIER